MEKNLQWLAVSCQDDKLGLASVQGLGGLVGSLSQLLVVGGLLNKVQDLGGKSLKKKKLRGVAKKSLGKNGIILCYTWNWGFKLGRGGNFYITARTQLKKIGFFISTFPFFHMFCMYTHLVNCFPRNFWLPLL